MITLYYIGGPWDLVKRVGPKEPMPTITVRETVGEPLYISDVGEGVVRNPNIEVVRFVDHRYMTHKLGPHTFVAVHEGVAR
jgi:hypothetical protein